MNDPQKVFLNHNFGKRRYKLWKNLKIPILTITNPLKTIDCGVKDVIEIYFANYYQLKNLKRFKIQKLLYKAIGKCCIKTPRWALESSVHYFLTVRGRWEWIILAIWIAHFLFLFCNKPAKKKVMAYVSFWRTEPPPPSQRASTLLAGPPLRGYVLYGLPLPLY